MSTKTAILAQLEALQSGPMTRADQTRSSILLARLANLRTDEAAETRASKREEAFRAYLRTGEYRDNTDAMSGAVSTEGGYYVAAQFNANYQEKLRSFSGLREGGATVQETAKGGQLTKPISDDVATLGVRIAENIQITNAIPAAGANRPTLFQFTSKGIILSMELAMDSGFDIQSYLQRQFASRIGKVTNKEFTNGVGGGPSGILPNVTNVVTAAATGAVTLAEIQSLQTQVDYGYRSPEAQPVYMFSEGVELILKNTVATGSGERMFPEMSEGKLCGYPYVVNVDMVSSLTASGLSIVFGSVKRGVLIHSVSPIVIASAERFADSGQMYYSMFHRQGALLSDANALAVLQQHA
jgi:HK97 family phage major capsid protein